MDREELDLTSNSGSDQEELFESILEENPELEMPYTFRKGDLPTLDLDHDDAPAFLRWEEMWNAYRDVSGLAAEQADRQVKVLKMCFQGETLTIVNNLGISQEDRGDPTSIVEALKAHVEGQVNKRAERHKFHQRTQNQGESIADFVVSLRTLAATCQFPTEEIKEDLIVDQMIEGCHDQEVVKELLKKKDANLKEALELAQSIETSKNNRTEIRGDPASTSNAFKKKQLAPKPWSKRLPAKTSETKEECSRCGLRHDQNKCPATNQKCANCGNQGHYAKKCRRRRSNNLVETFISSVNFNRDDPPTPKIVVRSSARKSANTKMLPDTGSDLCAAGEDFVKAIGEHPNNLQRANILPKTVNGKTVKVFGKLQVKFELKGRTTTEEVFIFHQINGPILSWSACKRLGILPEHYPEPIPAREIRALETTKTGSNRRKRPEKQKFATKNKDEPLGKETLNPSEKPAKDDELAKLETNDKTLATGPKDIRAMSREDENLPLHKLRGKAVENKEYQDLKMLIHNGFPDIQAELPENIRKYWRIKEHLSIDDELILHGTKLLIPDNFTLEMLHRMHEAHQGITRMQARARLAVYWLGIDQDIENFVKACRHCQQRQPQHPKESLIQKPKPERPFQEIALDFCQKNGLDFLVAVDCMTDWPEVWHFPRGTKAWRLINVMRDLFSRTAIPDVLWSDQGTQFMSKQFQNFLRQWGVKHKTSSPRNPQSNGRAEAAVKSMKNLITTTIRGRSLDADKLGRALLQYRNTPSTKDGLSPAQKLFGHQMQDRVPVHRRAFAKVHQQAIELAEERRKRYKAKEAEYFNQHAHDLPELKPGQPVAVWNPETRLWDIKGMVVLRLKHRKYLIKTNSGRQLTRNRRFLRVRRPLFLPRRGGGDGSAPEAQHQPPPQRSQAEQTSPELPRRSTREKKKPRRLIEEI